MKSKIFALAILVGFLLGCSTATNTINAEGNNGNNGTITIASFNIQIFGQSKAGKSDVMATLAKIITRYDLVAIQEIRDAQGTAIEKLEEVVDAQGGDYEYIIGLRLGRTTSKEQYAYMYKVSAVTPGASYTYDDTADVFHREPFIALFQAGDFTFVLINIHADPDEATEEIYALAQVVSNAQAHYPNEDDFIVLGDLNADCRYFDEEDTACPLRSTDYVWLISNSEDTNLAKSDCTYDRIIATEGVEEDYAGEAGVFYFDVAYDLTADFAKKVSDHYPVYAVFYVGRHSNTAETTLKRMTWGTAKTLQREGHR